MAADAVLADGLAFSEAARWRDGALWFSDFYTHRVHRLAPGGPLQTVCEVPGQPSGLGWLPGGDLLVVSMRDRRVLRLRDGALGEHADLNPDATFHANDMTVDRHGRAYVGNFGFDPWAGEAPAATCLLMVPAEGGRAVRVAEDLHFPNGMAFLADGRLVVAESTGHRLTVFDVGGEGTLTNRHVFAEMPGLQPDGIAVDPGGTLWVTTMQAGLLLGFGPDGAERHRIDLGEPCWSCAVSGDTLYVLTSSHWHADACLRERSGRVLALALP